MQAAESLTLKIPFVFEGHAEGPLAITLLALSMAAIVVVLCVKRGGGAGSP